MKKRELGFVLLLTSATCLAATPTTKATATEGSVTSAGSTKQNTTSATATSTTDAQTQPSDYQSMSNFTTTTQDVAPTTQTASANAQPAAPAKGMLTVDYPTYSLQLNSNPSTGYSWFLVAYPNDLLTITQHTYVPPQTNRVGAGGYEVWEFTAKPEAFTVPRVMKIQMMYARPWEINDQSTKQSFYIVSK